MVIEMTDTEVTAFKQKVDETLASIPQPMPADYAPTVTPTENGCEVSDTINGHPYRLVVSLNDNPSEKIRAKRMNRAFHVCWETKECVRLFLEGRESDPVIIALLRENGLIDEASA